MFYSQVFIKKKLLSDVWVSSFDSLEFFENLYLRICLILDIFLITLVVENNLKCFTNINESVLKLKFFYF